MKEIDKRDQFEEFLAIHFLTLEKFDKLEDWKKEEWRRQFTEYQKQERYLKQHSKMSQDNLMYEDAMERLESCGVPFAEDGTPLGVGWD